MKRGNKILLNQENKKIVWVASGAAIIILLAVSLLNDNFGIANITGSAISEKEIEQNVKEYFKNYLLQPGTNIEVTTIKEEHGLYKVTLLIETNTINIYVTKDGKLFFTGYIDLTNPIQNQ